MVMIDEAGLSGLPVSQLTGRAGVAWDERQALVDGLTQGGQVIEISGVLVAAARVAAVEEALITAVTRYHTSHPLEEGMPREEVRERLFANASTAVFDHVLRGLAERRRIIARDRIALAGHNVALTDEERARATRSSSFCAPPPSRRRIRRPLPHESMCQSTWSTASRCCSSGAGF